MASHRPGRAAPETAEAPASPPPYDDFLVLPLRVHLLSSDTLADVHCRLEDSDIERIVKKVNGIWHQAGIHWGLESIRREAAAEQTKFRLARELDPGDELGLYRLLVPESSRSRDGLNVYYIHRFAVNGVWLGGDVAVVQDTARLREVEGGIDEPIPRVTAHELGHALGLAHRQNRTNLLASGTTGTSLNAQEITTARRNAQRRKGMVTITELTRQAEEAEGRGDRAVARRFWTWLSEIPGTGADGARRRLEHLDRESGTRPGT
jgi:hypothetical protein